MSVNMPRTAAHSVHSATLADVLERVLDKGLVIAGDIKIKLVDIELLTIQIRLASTAGPGSYSACPMGIYRSRCRPLRLSYKPIQGAGRQPCCRPG